MDGVLESVDGTVEVPKPPVWQLQLRGRSDQVDYHISSKKEEWTKK